MNLIHDLEPICTCINVKWTKSTFKLCTCSLKTLGKTVFSCITRLIDFLGNAFQDERLFSIVAYLPVCKLFNLEPSIYD